MRKYIDTECSNYYGSVVFLQRGDNKFYIQLENYDGNSYVEIPESIFVLLDDYFEKNKPEVIYE